LTSQARIGYSPRWENKMNKKLRIIQLAILLILLSGCSQDKLPKWLSGEWTYDVAATMENLGSNASTETIDVTDGLRAGLIPMLKGMKMTFSGYDFIISFQGKRKLNEIEVYESGPNKVTIKQSDGVLRDFNKSENGFWTLSDDGQMKMFFERKDTQPVEDHNG
jgi:hypothetical protein